MVGIFRSCSMMKKPLITVLFFVFFVTGSAQHMDLDTSQVVSLVLGHVQVEVPVEGEERGKLLGLLLKADSSFSTERNFPATLDIHLKEGEVLKLRFNDRLFVIGGRPGVFFMATRPGYLDRLVTDYYQSVPSLDTLWRMISADMGGCLIGNQYVEKRAKPMGPVHFPGFLEHPASLAFLAKPRKELTYFLLNLLSDTSETRVHTCPFYTATNGEVAVYFLQRIFEVNWYDLKGFRNYRRKKVTSSLDSHQVWLQAILKDPQKREKMKKRWLEEYVKWERDNPK